MPHHTDRETSSANRAEAAEHLRELADEIEAGSLDLAGTSLDVPDQLDYEFEIKHEEELDGVEIEVEVKLKWIDPDGDIEDAETPHGTSLVVPDEDDDDLPDELEL
jgi:amphi-Trp domain-containing protein